jgi:hypothetical protein
MSETTINVISRLYDKSFKRVVTEIEVSQSSAWCAINNLKSVNIQARALWDTGAEICAVSSDFVNRLGLVSYGEEWFVGFGGEAEQEKYYLDIALGDNRHIYNIPAMHNPHMKSYDIIIGMNVITMGDFALIREDKGTRFVFKLD